MRTSTVINGFPVTIDQEFNYREIKIFNNPSDKNSVVVIRQSINVYRKDYWYWRNPSFCSYLGDVFDSESVERYLEVITLAHQIYTNFTSYFDLSDCELNDSDVYENFQQAYEARQREKETKTNAI